VLSRKTLPCRGEVVVTWPTVKRDSTRLLLPAGSVASAVKVWGPSLSAVSCSNGEYANAS
jgi:hypothetical protein